MRADSAFLRLRPVSALFGAGGIASAGPSSVQVMAEPDAKVLEARIEDLEARLDAIVGAVEAIWKRPTSAGPTVDRKLAEAKNQTRHRRVL